MHDRLTNAIDLIEELMRHIREHRSTYLPEPLQAPYDKAFRELEKRDEFESIRQRIRATPRQLLELSGLSGPVWDFKWATVIWQLKRGTGLLTSPQGVLKGWLKTLLAMLDTILDSIVKLFPGGEAVSETKAFLEETLGIDPDATGVLPDGAQADLRRIIRDFG